jgi:hypothetical protein
MGLALEFLLEIPCAATEQDVKFAVIQIERIKTILTTPTVARFFIGFVFRCNKVAPIAIEEREAKSDL